MRANKFFLAVFYIVSCSVTAFSQSDSLQIDEVTVSALVGRRPALRVPGAVTVIDSTGLNMQRAQTLLPALNNVAGVRMEERSPGSYRLSIRGSLLRSPFGVRNLKVYMEEMPLTNAGGETYINLIDQWALQNIEIHKGPDGSLFGANSGGVVRLGFFSDYNKTGTFVESTAGSYGFYRGSVRTDQLLGKHRVFVSLAAENTQGYRQQSAMQRRVVMLGDEWRYSNYGTLKVLAMYTRLQYETPGGLTLVQQAADPRQARPGTAFVPGPEQQQAGIYNNTALASVTNDLKLGKNVQHLICVFGSGTDFKNPFITNYENRLEYNYGLRTWLRMTGGEKIKRELILGSEVAFLSEEISNFENLSGSKGTVLSDDSFGVRQASVFSKVAFDFFNKLLIEASLSLNRNLIRRVDHLSGQTEDGELDAQWMPKLAASYTIWRGLIARALISKGYSLPTLQEMKPTPYYFNTNLKPEYGWNLEAGLRFLSSTGRWRFDLTGFKYRLNHAIVRGVDYYGREIFFNEGGTEQAGLELQCNGLFFSRQTGLLRYGDFGLSATCSDFRFDDYWSGGAVASNNKVTGVPSNVFGSTLTLKFPARLFLFVQNLYVSTLPLNDANTVWAPPYDLLLLKAGWALRPEKPFVQVALACNNLLDAEYSAGHDLNAFGGRFYNPSPGRNYFAQLLVRF